MKRSRPIVPKIFEEEINITHFNGLNTFGPHADIEKQDLRALTNYDLYGRYIKSRRGSQKFLEDICPDFDILQHIVFDAGDDEYVVIQQNEDNLSTFRFIKLSVGSTWANVINKTSLDQYFIASTLKADMFMSNGKIYVFHSEQNSVFEFDVVGGIFTRRKMGIPALQIFGMLTSTGPLKGKRVYGVELVYKDTTVTPNVDIIVSGPNRSRTSVSPLFGEGRLAYTTENPNQAVTISVSPTLNDGTNIAAVENDNWTHARLWRSLDITTATNATQDLEGESEITGRPDELYQVQEIDRITFLASLSGGVYSFAEDDILDDDVPFPLEIATADRLELVPIPPASTGVFHNDRIWASGITELPGPEGTIQSPNIESKIYFSPETDTKYSESMGVLHAIESEPGDGQKMIKLFSFREDLVGIKEGKTGRVRNGNPNLGWTTEDEQIGIEDKEFAQFVPDVGICARVNDQKDFRIFGFDLQWRSTFEGLSISRPIRNIIRTFTADDIDFLYINGKLMISGGKGTLLVLHTEQRSGWSVYLYSFNTKSEAVLTFMESTRALVINGGQPVIEIEVEDSEGVYLDNDYNPVTDASSPITLPLTTWKFQDNGGRSLIEERFISIVADLTTKLIVTPYVNGKQWQPAFPLLIDPEDYPDNTLKETE